VAVAAGALGVAWALVPREPPRAHAGAPPELVSEPDPMMEVAGGIGEMPTPPPVEAEMGKRLPSR
jgi:hypothetical protein